MFTSDSTISKYFIYKNSSSRLCFTLNDHTKTFSYNVMICSIL